jgi:hypothetical protein
VDLEGAWATVIKIDDPELRAKYKNGEWAGVSMGGTAVVEQEKADVERLVELLAKAISPSTKEPDTNMTPQELEAITKALKEGITSMTTELVKSLKPEAPKPPEAPKDDTPVFKGNPDNERAVELHARQVELHVLRKSVDWKDPESIRGYKEQVAALKAEWKDIDEAAGITAPEEKPVRKAGPAGGEGEKPTLQLVGMSKEAADMLKAGMAHAEALEKARKAQ